VALEAQYGAVAEITSQNRLSLVQLRAREKREKVERRDKTGSRTYLGIPAGGRRQSQWELQTYLTGWTDQSLEPSAGPLLQAAMGSAAVLYTGGNVDVQSGSDHLHFTSEHGLSVGQAVTFGGEIRFVTAVLDESSVTVNAPFSGVFSDGAVIGATATYQPGATPYSVSLFDYWSPATSLQRILTGAGVGTMSLGVNGDLHQFQFAGPAKEILSEPGFATGQGGLAVFPAEPALGDYAPEVVPGNLGQVWIGATPNRFYTLTEAKVTLDNNLDARDREYGTETARCLAYGAREVKLDFTLLADDRAATQGLYSAAQNREPVAVMLQLGQQPGRMCGIYLKQVVLENPEFDDRGTRLAWRFTNARAQGTVDDEISVAFG
jgi:hypothetical protein